MGLADILLTSDGTGSYRVPENAHAIGRASGSARGAHPFSPGCPSASDSCSMFRLLGTHARTKMLSLPVIVSIPAVLGKGDADASASKPRPAHHTPEGYFVNPWDSYKDLGTFNPSTLWHMFRDWQSKPVRRSRPPLLTLYRPGPH